MIVYQTDTDGFLTGPVIADESPLEPGSFLIPARCVEVPPPAFDPQTHRARFDGGSWSLEEIAPPEPTTPQPVKGIPDIVSASYLADGRVEVALAGNLRSFCFYDGTPDGPLEAHLHAWLQTEGNAIEPYVPPPEPVFDIAAYAADRRWRSEIGGIVVAGIPVATDDRSKLMITGARVAAMADPAWTTTWHGTDGNSYPVDTAAMVAISDAVQAHVNATFATFATVKAAIEAGAITTAAQVDAAFG